MNTATAHKPGKNEITTASNFGDFQSGVYAEAMRGVISRYPFDFASIERKASETLPDWVYRYVSAAAGDGRTQHANVDAYSRYGIVPRMMVSPRSAICPSAYSANVSPRRYSCARSVWWACARPIFRATWRPHRRQPQPLCRSRYRLSRSHRWRTSSSTPGKHQAFFSCTSGDRELAASFIDRAERSGYCGLVLTMDTWTLGYRPADLERGNFPQFRGFCMPSLRQELHQTSRQTTARIPSGCLAALSESLRPFAVVGGPALD